MPSDLYNTKKPLKVVELHPLGWHFAMGKEFGVHIVCSI